MSLFVKSDAGSKFYIDIEHGDVFEEGADGVFVLKRIGGRKERIVIDAIPDAAGSGTPVLTRFSTERCITISAGVLAPAEIWISTDTTLPVSTKLEPPRDTPL